MLLLPETTRDDTLKAYASEFFIRYMQDDHAYFREELETTVEQEGRFDSADEMGWYIADTLFSDEKGKEFTKYVEAVNKLWPEFDFPASADLFMGTLLSNHLHIWDDMIVVIVEEEDA